MKQRLGCRNLMAAALLSAVLCIASSPSVHAELPPAQPPSLRTKVVLVKPVLLVHDNKEPVRQPAIPKRLLDDAFSALGAELLVLDSSKWSGSQTTAQETDSAALVQQARRHQVIHDDPRVLTLLLTPPVPGQSAPRSQAFLSANTALVRLGPEEPDGNPATNAKAIANAIKSLIKTDPRPGATAPTSQADPAAPRKEATTIPETALLVERVRCHTREEAAALLTDESWEPYVTAASDDALRFALGMKEPGELPPVGPARARFAREGHAAMADEFTPQEQSALRKAVTRIADLTGRDWPLLSRLPWHFIKSKPALCDGHPHTRGLAIVLPSESAAHLASNDSFALFLLLHEKLHVVQRLVPSRFEALFRAYGYLPVRLAEGEAARARLVENPDALIHQWAARSGKELAMVATHYRARDDGKLDMLPVARRLEPLPGGSFRLGDILENDPVLNAWREGFPVAQGFDDPRELSAYISSVLLRREYLGGKPVKLAPAQEAIYQESKRAFREILAITAD